MFELKDILLILVGAVIGFGIDRIKSSMDRRLARKQLHEELELNRRMIPHFRRYLMDTLHALANGFAPNLRAVHFARASYDANFSAVLPLLTQAERSSFHLIYEHLAICTEASDEASILLTTIDSKEEFKRRATIASGVFDSLLTTVDSVNEQIDLHLKGSPRDDLILNSEPTK
jgi:hypothetical protein